MKNLIGSKSRAFAGIVILFILVITGSCKKTMYDPSTGGSGGKGGPGAGEVFIQGMAFNPLVLTVAKGTTITWTNKDAMDHTVTSDGGLFNSGSIASNGTYPHTFSSAGTFPYHCSIHPSMTGKIVVN